jgi:hypothetical protein
VSPRSPWAVLWGLAADEPPARLAALEKEFAGQPVGWYVFDKSLGDVLSATAASLALAASLPRCSVVYLAVVAFVACVAVEVLQLFEVNRTLLRVPVLRWFLGTTFLWHDIACYLIGVAAGVVLDVLVLPRAEKARPRAVAGFPPDLP